MSISMSIGMSISMSIGMSIGRSIGMSIGICKLTSKRPGDQRAKRSIRNSSAIE